jgi:hypothetical protein
MRIKERFPRVIAALLHPLDLRILEGIHRDRADKGDVHTQSTVGTGTIEAYKRPKFWRSLQEKEIPLVNTSACPCADERQERGMTDPLRGWRVAVTASIIPIDFRYLEQLRSDKY